MYLAHFGTLSVLNSAEVAIYTVVILYSADAVVTQYLQWQYNIIGLVSLFYDTFL